MWTRIHCPAGVLLGMFVAAATASANAQSTQSQVGSAAPAPEPRTEVAVTYEHLNSNVLPAGCGCFGLNGGSADFAWRPRGSHFAEVFEAAVVHTGSITSSNYTLTLSTFQAGARYLPKTSRTRLQPYADMLVGFAHTSGTLVQGPTGVSAGIAFAGSAGGGLDVRITRRVWIRAIEADYLVTTFANGTTDFQNNLRLDAGLTLHF